MIARSIRADIQLVTRDQFSLSCSRWPVDRPRATVAIIPGYADHSGRYGHVADFLNLAGMEVWAIDLRGHGRSSGRRGHIVSFSNYVDDVDSLVDEISRQSPNLPRFLLGHSMGGLVTLQYLLHRNPAIRGFIISSPFLGVAMKVPAIKVLLGRVMSRLYPALAIPSGIDPFDLSRDRAVGEAYRTDPLVFKTATARWFTETMAAIEEAKSEARKITLPCLVLQAADDRLADPRASRPLFDLLGSVDKSYVEYPGFFHEIFNELEKEKPLTEARDWMLRRLE